MKKQKTVNYTKRVFIMLIVAGILATILALLLILRTNATIAERTASGFSRGWISFFSKITSIFPFSLYEAFLILAIIGVTTLIIVAIVFFCKRSPLRACTYLAVILIASLAFGDIYTLTAGFAYYRETPDLPYFEADYISDEDKDQLFALAEFMIDDFNETANSMQRDSDGRTIGMATDELSDLLAQEYERLNGIDYFSSFTPRAKTITSKRIMSHMRITGVFFAPFGEANVNPLTPSSDMPVTMAHELAHSKGAMRESDANLVAYYITITSDNDYLRYSGYIGCFSYVMRIVNVFDPQKRIELERKIDPIIYNEMKLNNDFWEQYDLLDKITDAFNNFYLKLQGQKEGTNSYVEPTLPPNIVETPSPTPGGDVTIETRYNLNNVQRMMLEALDSRAKARQA